MTKLEAVNLVLMACGQPPTSSLDTGGASTPAIIERLIDQEATQSLTEGWHFNRRRDVTIARDGSNKIPVPAGVLAIDLQDSTIDTTHINGFLYNLDENTDVFTADVKVNYVLSVAWDQCPVYFRNFVAHQAAARFAEYRDMRERIGIIYARRDAARTRARRMDGEESDSTVANTFQVKRATGWRMNPWN